MSKQVRRKIPKKVKGKISKETVAALEDAGYLVIHSS